MSFGEGNLHERVEELERECERWRKKSEMLERYIEGPDGWRESCNAHESLVLDMYADLRRITEGGRKLEYETRMDALGLMEGDE